MKNRNLPSAPVETHDSIYGGLTKLEEAAIAAMGGLLASNEWTTVEITAETAVKHANALFDELEKSE